MSKTRVIKNGDKYGEWTVIKAYSSYKNKKARSLCRCSCGVEREVPNGSLRNGHSKSCGHLRRRTEPYIEKAVEPNILLRGDYYYVYFTKDYKYFKFGPFETLEEAKKVKEEKLPPPDPNRYQKTIERGNKRLENYKKELIGKRFGKLVVLDVYRERDKEVYRYRLKCKCDCGNITHPTLISVVGKNANVTSCGCVREERGEEMLDSYLFKGTRVTNLQMKTKSKSGVKGVRKVPSGRYTAHIWFKNKTYYLGTFDTIEEARAARKAAEEKYFKPILEEFNKIAKYKVDIKEDEEKK